MATKIAKDDLNFIYGVIGFIFMMVLFGLIIYFTVKNNKDKFAQETTDEYFSSSFTSDALTKALKSGTLP